MAEFVLLVCMHFSCYTSPDGSIIQMAIAHPREHPDTTTRVECCDGRLKLIAVPIEKEA